MVRISLEGDEILWVQGKRTQGVAKTLLNTKKGRVKLRLVRAMSMTIQSSVKDKILATPIDTSKVENAPAEMLRKANVVTDTLSRKERVKPRCVRAMAMTIQYGIKGMTFAAQSEAFKQENVLVESLHGLDQHMERKEDESLYLMDRIRFHWIYIDEIIARNGILVMIKLRARWMINLAVWQTLQKVLETRLDLKIGDSSLTRLELVQETTDKVVLVKKPKAARDRQKSYVDYRCKPLDFEVGDHVLLKVMPCLADANLHVPLDEIEADKTLHFVEETMGIIDREI
uniref:Reverse transcriptase domain-containing protein n=1 Tax=Tanacetum cinerariifolium TaxID=118510 RepID=A0A6L2J9Y1_TANCI|nr:reverse transcriptase domain-containing protein [Tanacetum cinerariifolium]